MGVVVLVGALVIGVRASGTEEDGLSPAQVVALRFPSEWSSRVTASVSDALTPVDDALMFSPTLTNAPEQLPLAGGAEPALALADPGEVSALSAPAVAPPPNIPVAVAPAPPRKSPAPRRPSGLLNEAQLASIKGRLRLSADQEPYWPAVESALRAIGLRQHHQARGGHAPVVEPDSAEVQQLKSAAVPLIMRLREDQKREVRELAHLMGLGSVAAQF